MSWTVIAPYALDDAFGYQSANNLRGNLITLVSRRTGRYLGGSREWPNACAPTLRGGWRGKEADLGPNNVWNYLDVEIDGTDQAGVLYVAKVEVRVDDPRCTITPTIRNMTDASDAAVGVACSGTRLDYNGFNQRQALVLTIASGAKVYRLQYSVSDVSWQTWAMGELVSFATA